MRKEFVRAVLFCLLLLVSVGCGAPPSGLLTPTPTPGPAGTPTATPTKFVPGPLPGETQTPTPTATPAGESYKAVYQEAVGYSGTICDLGKPFTLVSQSAINDITVKFTPTGSEAGAFTLKGSLFGGAGGVGVTNIDATGEYTVTRAGGKATQLVLNVLQASGKNTVLGGGTDSGFQIFIDLAEIEKC